MAASTRTREESDFFRVIQSTHQPANYGRTYTTKVSASIKAGMAGGISFLILMLIGLIPPPDSLPIASLAMLVIPGYLVVCLATGLLAGVLTDEALTSVQEGGEVGWMAGFWAGIGGAIIAMLMAATGMLMVDFGQGILSQFSAEQLEAWRTYGSPETIALAGRVLGALIVYGFIGALLSALISAVGGMIFTQLAQES